MSPVVVALVSPRHVELVNEPARPLGADEVRIRTLFSGVSAGTKMAFDRTTNPYVAKRWDPAQRLFVAETDQRQQYPITSWGYEQVGEVVEFGASSILQAVLDFSAVG
jgi:hypothetical protein